MLGLTPALHAALERDWAMSPAAASLAASAVGGIVAGVLSHPFDVVRTHTYVYDHMIHICMYMTT